MCVSILDAPEGTFTQTDRFTTDPRGKYPAQWHARYATGGKSRQANFLALLDVECRGVETALRWSGDRLGVGIAGRKMMFESTGYTGIAP